MKLKTTKITKNVDEVKDAEEFSLSLRVVEIDDEEQAEKLRRTLKLACIKFGGQQVIEETTDG